MFFKLNKNIKELNRKIEQKNFQEFIYVLGNKKELLKRNFLAGLARGIGIGIGVTIITSILVSILQKIVTLNIPIIGEYISNIVEIVQQNINKY